MQLKATVKRSVDSNTCSESIVFLRAHVWHRAGLEHTMRSCDKTNGTYLSALAITALRTRPSTLPCSAPPQLYPDCTRVQQIGSVTFSSNPTDTVRHEKKNTRKGILTPTWHSVELVRQIVGIARRKVPANARATQI